MGTLPVDEPYKEGGPEYVVELHADLVRLYRQQGPRIQQNWRSMDHDDRSRLFNAHSPTLPEGNKDPSGVDRSKTTPEWNHLDIALGSTDNFLNLLQHRATASLQEQYLGGLNGGPGDCLHILNKMLNEGLLPAKGRYLTFTGTWVLFEDGKYCQRCKCPPDMDDPLRDSRGRRRLMVPSAVGELIMQRQARLIHGLKIFADVLLGVRACLCSRLPGNQHTNCSTPCSEQLSSPESPKQLTLPRLCWKQSSSDGSPKQLTLSDVFYNSQEMVDLYEDAEFIIKNVPAVLVDRVQFWFDTRPECVPDEHWVITPHLSDRHISETVVDVLQESLQILAVWKYISRLVSLLTWEDMPGQLRSTVLRELSAACNVEYTAAQGFLKRILSTLNEGRKFFKRTTTKGNITQVSLRCNPEALTALDPQHHYTLRLCHSDTTWPQAREWLQRLSDLYRAHPDEKDRVSIYQLIALGRLNMILKFIRDVSQLVDLPALNSQGKQVFPSLLCTLDKDIAHLKTGIDIGDYAIPIPNMMEPGMAEKAFTAIDDYMIEHKGMSLGDMYNDLIERCRDGILEKLKNSNTPTNAQYVAPEFEAAEYATKFAVQEPKHKVKTRPEQPVAIEAEDPNEEDYRIATSALSQEQPDQPSQTFQVKASTHSVFAKLFSRSSEARGAVNWDAFTGAMADLGFSIVPKTGSIYTFIPPESMAITRKLTIHRPHHSRIEGAYLLLYSRRINRVYGWDESSFIES